ncbi:energy transducer TonB [Flavobacterium sp. P21]|uniref:energy transducer TonB n=1 Tax=Flavobacterium sp. P21 TaxID=3423948 RepID=UPI003D6684F3
MLFSFIFIASCQKNTNEPTIADPTLRGPQKSVKIESNIPEKLYNATEVDVHPQYPGGIQKFQAFLKKNYVIPEEVVQDEMKASAIFASFVIEKDGRLSDIKILHDFGYGSGEELQRVLKLSPNWKPAIKNGKAVRCMYSVPYYCI